VWYCKGVQKKNFKVYKQPWKTWSIFFNSWCVIKQCFLAPLSSEKRSKRKLRKVLIYRKFDRMNNKDLMPFSSFIALRNSCSIHRLGLCMFRAKFQGVIQWLYCWLLLDSRRKWKKKTCENKAERGGTRRGWTFSTFLHRIWTLFYTPLEFKAKGLWTRQRTGNLTPSLWTTQFWIFTVK